MRFFHVENFLFIISLTHKENKGSPHHLPIRTKNTVRVLHTRHMEVQDLSGQWPWQTLRSLQVSWSGSSLPCCWPVVSQCLPCKPAEDPLVQTSCLEQEILHLAPDLESIHTSWIFVFDFILFWKLLGQYKLNTSKNNPIFPVF